MLLQNPVIQGLLGGGPNAIRAQADQQRMALAPRAGGGMAGAPGPIVMQDRSMDSLGQGLAGLGQGMAAIGQMREKAAQREAFEAAIATLPPEEQAMARLYPDAYVQAKARAMFAKPDSMKPVALGQGQVLVDPVTGREIAAGPKKADPLDIKGSAETGFYVIGKDANGRPTATMLIEPKTDAMTSLQKDYAFAKKDGFKGSFTDFVRDTRSTAIERAPQGYERTPEGLRPIPGGPADPETVAATETAKKQAAADAEKRSLFPKAQAAISALEMNSNVVLKTIDKALDQIGPLTTGYGGMVLSALPQTEARDLARNLETIKANIGFDRLQQMRESSPTGGALGAVSEFENRLLQAVQGSLDPTQSTSQLKENLAQIKRLYQQVLDEKRKAFRSDYGSMVKADPEATAAPAETPAEPSLNILIDKYAGEE